MYTIFRSGLCQIDGTIPGKVKRLAVKWTRRDVLGPSGGRHAPRRPATPRHAAHALAGAPKGVVALNLDPNQSYTRRHAAPRHATPRVRARHLFLCTAQRRQPQVARCYLPTSCALSLPFHPYPILSLSLFSLSLSPPSLASLVPLPFSSG